MSRRAGDPIRVLHVITTLDRGGAESMLRALLSRTDRTRFDPRAVSLLPAGEVGEEIEAGGTPVDSLGLVRGVPDPRAVRRLTRRIDAFRPHVVQSWMYHADLLAGVALATRPFGIRPALAWNLRHSDLATGGHKRSTIWTARACAALSRRIPRAIVCGSRAARDAHLGLGYAADRMIVIPNGFDVARFRPDEGIRADTRRELGLGAGPVVGHVGRFHPDKDHVGFALAAARIAERCPEVRFVLCGAGVEPGAGPMPSLLRRAGIESRCLLLGTRSDMPRIYPALDVLVSSSVSEGFPNVVGEALSCAVPCVATEVGDAGRLVDGGGRSIPPRDPKALADAVLDLLGRAPEERLAMGKAGRRRIVENYTIERSAERYMRLHGDLARSGPANGRVA